MTQHKSTDQLTIAIPTYRRVKELKGLLRQIAESPMLRSCSKVIVVNDSGTASELDKYKREILLNKNLTEAIDLDYLENDCNKGFPRTLMRLIENVHSRHMLVMADDDVLIEDEFLAIMAFLEDKDPDLCSPWWLYRDGRLGRGGEATRKVTYEEHRRCCGHVPGLIFNVERVRKYLPLLEDRLNQGCAAASTYPSVILAIPLILENDNIWFYKGAVAREGHGSESGIKDFSGNHYAAAASRIQQIAAFDEYILSFPRSDARDRILRESRGWSIAKAIGADPDLKAYMQLRMRGRSLAARLARAGKKYLSIAR